MSYFFSKTLADTVEHAVDRVTEGLKAEGFGVLTDIDIQATMKARLDKDLAPYRILGACHPPSAYEALEAEKNIGLMLPCNVIVRQADTDTVEVAAIDPIASMQSVENEALGDVATEVQAKLKTVIENL